MCSLHIAGKKALSGIKTEAQVDFHRPSEYNPNPARPSCPLNDPALLCSLSLGHFRLTVPTAPFSLPLHTHGSLTPRTISILLPIRPSPNPTPKWVPCYSLCSHFVPFLIDQKAWLFVYCLSSPSDNRFMGAGMLFYSSVEGLSEPHRVPSSPSTIPTQCGFIW